MSTRKRKMTKKAMGFIDFGYQTTFRQMMISYKFWRRVIKKKNIDRFVKRHTWI